MTIFNTGTVCIFVFLKYFLKKWIIRQAPNVDEDGFIKATAFIAANVHDANHFIDLLSGK